MNDQLIQQSEETRSPALAALVAAIVTPYQYAKAMEKASLAAAEECTCKRYYTEK